MEKWITHKNALNIEVLKQILIKKRINWFYLEIYESLHLQKYDLYNHQFLIETGRWNIILTKFEANVLCVIIIALVMNFIIFWNIHTWKMFLSSENPNIIKKMSAFPKTFTTFTFTLFNDVPVLITVILVCECIYL